MDKTISLATLAAMVDGEVNGDATVEITGFGPLDSAGSGDISFVVKTQYVNQMAQSGAAAFLVKKDMDVSGSNVVIVEDPYLASAVIQNYFLEKPFIAAGIHETAVVGNDCTIDDEVTIGPHAVIGNRVKIGPRTEIFPGVSIGDDVVIGEACRIRSNVTIEYGTELGNGVIIHANTVIGSDGYGYATDRNGDHVKRPQLGIVRIGDDVEIGSNCSVDRAAFGVTWIKSGAKIDNLVQIAHNCVIGENSLIVSQVGLAGSTIMGRNVVFGGRAMATGHQKIGAGTMVAGGSAVHGDHPAGSRLAGIPAFNAKLWFRSAALFSKLPELYRDVKKIKKELTRLSLQTTPES